PTTSVGGPVVSVARSSASPQRRTCRRGLPTHSRAAPPQCGRRRPPSPAWPGIQVLLRSPTSAILNSIELNLELTVSTRGGAWQVAGRVVVVTGGSRGLGKAMCHHFAADGDHVVVASGTREACDELAAELRALLCVDAI